jgi:hypothetical protein
VVREPAHDRPTRGVPSSKPVPIGEQKALFFFSFETDFTGRVKAEPQIETWQQRSAAAFTPAVILFIALPEPKDNIDPG